MSALAPLLEAFFTDRLLAQRQASPNTVAAYRDTYCLLLRFAHTTTGKQPHQLDIADLDAGLIGAFLTDLETSRGVSARTRNARLSAVRSLFGYAAYYHPEHGALIQRVLAIPPKRCDRALGWRPREWCNSVTRVALCCALCRECLSGVYHPLVGGSGWGQVHGCGV